MENQWHAKSISDVFLDVKSAKQGLSEKEAKLRLKEYGHNKLPEEKPLSRFKILQEQFKSPLIYILIIAGIFTLALGVYTDSIVIFGAVILNTVVGYIQENKASKAIRELKKVLSLKAIVFRGTKEEEISAEDLVPGDVVLLKPGDKVPADGRLIENYNLKINESSLTGEWLSAVKNTKVLPEDTSLADRDNMVYMGTVIEDGHGRAIVVRTGKKTEIGKIVSLVREKKEEKTPYQKKIANFSKTIGMIIGLVCLAIFVEGMVTGGEFIEMFTVSVAVAVAAIPEGLPVAMTVILALGMQGIFRKKGLVRKLASAETLGSTSVIATDKTGTLTQAKMAVAGIYTPFAKEEEKKLTLKAAILCSEAFVENPDDPPDMWKIRGMSTEKALISAGARFGLSKNQLEESEPRIEEILFSPEYKYSASLRSVSKSRNIIYIKGSPEIILQKSKYLKFDNRHVEISKERREDLNKKYEELAGKGYRLLGVAYKKISNLQDEPHDFKKLADDLIFAGFIFLEDPLRKEAKKAIQICHKAGIRTIIITGDHKLTAKAIANKLGINVEDKNILEGKYLDKMFDEEFEKRLKDIQIYARMEPKHKLRIIEAWQKRGEVIAMTGDGINDAPALKSADIGVALGSGTEVAKEVSDLVLLTDDFSVIVAAVEEGRAIIDNIRKVITYLISDSFTEIVLVGVSIIAQLPLPVTAVQILWVNLIEDGLPDIALAFEPKEKDLMKHKPGGHEIPLLTREMKAIIFIIGIVTSIIILGLFFWLYNQSYSIEYVRTIIFACLAIDSISYVFCCKSLRRNLWHINIFDNKFLLGAWFLGLVSLLLAIYLPVFNSLLGTVPLSSSAWAIIIGLGLVNIVLIELIKYYFIVRHETD